MSLTNLTAQAATAAIEENLFLAFANFRHCRGAEFRDDQTMMRFSTGVPFPLLNGVFRARLPDESLDPEVEATLAHFRSRNVPMIWWTGPATRPAHLGNYLEARGLRRAADLPGMAVDLAALRGSPPMPTDLTIEPVGDRSTLREWLQVFAIGFELPAFAATAIFELFNDLGLGPTQPFRHYVGRVGGKPVATSSRFLSPGVVGIYNVATVAEARRRGIGTALTHVALEEARRLGVRIGILHSSPMGGRVYEALGFQEYCKVSQYVLGGAP